MEVYDGERYKRLMSARIVSHEQMESSAIDIDGMIKASLAHELANYLLEHIEETPARIDKGRHRYGYEYRLRLNIVSDEFIKEYITMKETLKLRSE